MTVRTDRRQQRAEIQSTWSTYTPRVPGTPFTRRDLEDAGARLEAEEAEVQALPESPAKSHWCATLARFAR